MLIVLLTIYTHFDLVHDIMKEIEEPSIWGIFTVPELETAIDDRIGLIGDAVCGVEFTCSALNTSTLSRSLTRWLRIRAQAQAKPLRSLFYIPYYFTSTEYVFW